MKSTPLFSQINNENNQVHHKPWPDPVTSLQQYSPTTPQRHRLLRLQDVMAATGVARTFIYAAIKQRRFPAPVKAGSASLWVEAEIQAWIQERMASRQLE